MSTTCDFNVWRISYYKALKVDLPKEPNQNEVLLYLKENHSNPIIDNVVFSDLVTFTDGLRKLTLNNCQFKGGLSLKELSVSRDLIISNINVHEDLLVWEVFVGGDYISDKSFVQMMVTKKKKSRVKTGAITIRGQLIHI